MSTTTTLDQAKHVLELISQKKTPKEQLTALFESGLLSDLLDANLGQVDREAFRALLGLRSLKPEVLSLLEPLGIVNIAAARDKFVVKKKFVLDTSRKAKVKISFIGDNFLDWFGGAVEDPTSKQILRCHKLRQWSVDGPIITELGGVEQAKTTLFALGSLMEKQAEGEAGALLVNGYANICYVPQKVTKLDGNNFSYTNRLDHVVEEAVSDAQYLFEVAGQWFVLRAVRVCWDGGGWDVSVDSVEDPRRWDGGRQVFSPQLDL